MAIRWDVIYRTRIVCSFSAESEAVAYIIRATRDDVSLTLRVREVCSLSIDMDDEFARA